MSDLPADLQPIKPGQIEIALDTTYNRERLASLPVRHVGTPSPRSSLAIPEREDDEDEWVSMKLERVPANTVHGTQRTNLISPDDGYYFNGVNQATFLHGQFKTPLDEEAAKEIIRNLDPELAKRVFDQKPRSPSAHPDSPSPSKNPESRTPFEDRKSESRSHDHPESSRDKAADNTFANAPASQDSSLITHKRCLQTGLDGAADFTPLSDPKRARLSSSTFSAFAYPQFEEMKMSKRVKSRKRRQRIEKITADIGIFVQSRRGQARPPINSPLLAQSGPFSPMPRTTSLNRLKDFDEIERVDAERAMLWDNMRQSSRGEYREYDKINFRAQGGSYDYLKKGPAWDLQLVKRDMEEWVNGVDGEEWVNGVDGEEWKGNRVELDVERLLENGWRGLGGGKSEY